jgi:hypothetical protein
VINLEESVALTHNVVTEANLVNAIDLLAEPAGCAPGRCGGDVMGDVPLWVAQGGSTTPAVGAGNLLVLLRRRPMVTDARVTE